MDRAGQPIAHWLGIIIEPGGQLTSEVTRLTGGAARTTPFGRRSVAVAVLASAAADSPTVAGAPVPVGTTVTFSSDFPGNQLPAVVVSTVPGDDVIVLETFTGTGDPADFGVLLLEQGGALLREGGGRLVLESVS